MLAKIIESKDSALWEINNVDGEVDVGKHCYASMDRLLERQEQIQQKLFDGCYIIYTEQKKRFSIEKTLWLLLKIGF